MRVISGTDLVEDLGKKLQPATAQTSLSFLPCSAPSLPKRNTGCPWPGAIPKSFTASKRIWLLFLVNELQKLQSSHLCALGGDGQSTGRLCRSRDVLVGCGVEE